MIFRNSKTNYNYFNDLQNVLQDDVIIKYKFKFEEVSIGVDVIQKSTNIYSDTTSLTCYLNPHLYNFVFNNVAINLPQYQQIDLLPEEMKIEMEIETIQLVLHTMCDTVFIKYYTLNIDLSMIKSLKYLQKNFKCKNFEIYDIYSKKIDSKKFESTLINPCYIIDKNTKFVLTNVLDDPRYFISSVDKNCLRFYIESFFVSKNKNKHAEYNIPQVCIVIENDHFNSKEFFARLIRAMKVCGLYYSDANQNTSITRDLYSSDIFSQNNMLMVLNPPIKRFENFFTKDVFKENFDLENVFYVFIVNTPDEANRLKYEMYNYFQINLNCLKIYETEKEALMTPHEYIKEFEKMNSRVKKETRDSFYIYIQRFSMPMSILKNILNKTVNIVKTRTPIENHGFNEDDLFESSLAHSIDLKSFIDNGLKK